MAVHFQFKSSTVKESIPIDGHFITVGNLKEKIVESKQLRRGNFDLVVSNSQTKEDYLDDGTLIPRNTTVLIRRIPAQASLPIITAPVPKPDELKVDNDYGGGQTVKSGDVGVHSSEMHYPDDLEWDEFGNDLYAIPETFQSQPGNPVQDAPPPSEIDEDSKIKALIETPALDWQRQSGDGFGSGRGFGRGMGGRMMGGRGGFGRGGLERKTPPQGYICHRCKVPGHFIQHCPTNGDPNYDIKRVKPPTGIPKSMLMATPDGSYALPSGAVAVLRPNEAAFEKEIEGLPSTRPVGDLPPELHCPLCKQVMKDAVLTSKCCFTSFCDKCIREYIITKSICVCGVANVLADDLLPNKTLRDTINRILESNNSSGDIGGGASQIQDMESRIPLPKAPSPTHSVASKGEQAPPPQKQDVPKVHEVVEEVKPLVAQQTMDRLRLPKGVDASEATHESASLKEQAASQGSAPLADEEVQQKPVSGEAAKKKKKKKVRMPMPVAAAEMQWRAAQDQLAAENYMMSMGGPAAYNPYWGGMQPGMDAFIPPYGGGVPYNAGFGFGPMDMPFGGAMPPMDPFVGQGMMPFLPPQRDLMDFGMGFNAGPPLLSREEFEARKANAKRKRDVERRGDSREAPKDREYGREVSSSADMKFRSKAGPPGPSSDHPNRLRSDRPSPDRRSRDPRSDRPSPDRRSRDPRSDRPSPDRRSRDPRSDRPSPDRRSRDPRSDRPSPDRRSRDPEHPRSSSKRKLEHDHSHSRRRDHRDDHHLDSDHHRDRDHKDEHHHRDHQHRSSNRHRSESTTKLPPPEAAPQPPSQSTKAMSAAERKKASVFSRISFPPEESTPNKRKLPSSSEAAPATTSGTHKGPSSNGHHEPKTTSVSTKKTIASVPAPTPAATSVDYESSDDDRHFKRRPRYESSPPVTGELEEAPRRSKGSTRDREREREKERGSYNSKHR